MIPFAIMYFLPLGTIVRLEDDYDDESHEIEGYEWTRNGSYILFKDGGRLNSENRGSIKEILRKGEM